VLREAPTVLGRRKQPSSVCGTLFVNWGNHLNVKAAADTGDAGLKNWMNGRRYRKDPIEAPLSGTCARSSETEPIPFFSAGASHHISEQPRIEACCSQTRDKFMQKADIV
jgi:hypothetical protein